jgi:hypothetical protein
MKWKHNMCIFYMWTSYFIVIHYIHHSLKAPSAKNPCEQVEGCQGECRGSNITNSGEL